MNSDEVFIRAALYEECSKSTILKHVDIEKSSIETLRELLNKNNALVFRKIPIIFSKFVVKQGLTFLKSKISHLKFITPENINITIESDELQYLLNSQSTMKPNIVFIVSKNILISLVGSSINAFKDEILGKYDGNGVSFTKIPVDDLNATNASNFVPFEAPTTYTNTFEGDTPQKSKLSRQTSRNSNYSYKSSKSSVRSSTSSVRSTNKIYKTKINNNDRLSPIPNNKNTSDIKKQLIVDQAIEQLENEYMDVIGDVGSNIDSNVRKIDNTINIIENIQIKKPDDPTEEYHISEYESDVDMHSEQSDADETHEVKITEIQKTGLKPKTAEFYSLIAADDRNLNNVDLDDSRVNDLDNIRVNDAKAGDDINDIQVNDKDETIVEDLKKSSDNISTKIINIQIDDSSDDDE